VPPEISFAPVVPGLVECNEMYLPARVVTSSVTASFKAVEDEYADIAAP